MCVCVCGVCVCVCVCVPVLSLHKHACQTQWVLLQASDLPDSAHGRVRARELPLEERQRIIDEAMQTKDMDNATLLDRTKRRAWLWSWAAARLRHQCLTLASVQCGLAGARGHHTLSRAQRTG